MMYPHLTIDLKLGGKEIQGMVLSIAREIRNELIKSGMHGKEATEIAKNYQRKTLVAEKLICNYYKDKSKKYKDKNKKMKNNMTKAEKYEIKEARKELSLISKKMIRDNHDLVLLETKKIINVIF